MYSLFQLEFLVNSEMSPKKYKNQLAHNVRSESSKNLLKWKEFLDEFC